jgi:hypothetical protein
VGTQVVLAAAALLLGLPARWLPTDPAAPLGPTLLAVLGALLVPTAVLLPFDWLGGRVVVPGPEARTRWRRGRAR